MPPPIKTLTDLLNAPLAVAMARAVLLTAPVVLAILLWAGQRWLDEQVADAPVILRVTSDGTTFRASLSDHDKRILALEEYRRLAIVQAGEDATFRREVLSELRGLTREFDRLAGAVEAQNKGVR